MSLEPNSSIQTLLLPDGMTLSNPFLSELEFFCKVELMNTTNPQPGACLTHCTCLTGNSYGYCYHKWSYATETYGRAPRRDGKGHSRSLGGSSSE